mmetsp:Transcript_41158/g.128465  ORF Transcript_41158/g.128465 Transcript_41158/m.128465 type:complete len:206 (+) Transcript_41158:237-854(+)
MRAGVGWAHRARQCAAALPAGRGLSEASSLPGPPPSPPPERPAWRSGLRQLPSSSRPLWQLLCGQSRALAEQAAGRSQFVRATPGYEQSVADARVMVATHTLRLRRSRRGVGQLRVALATTGRGKAGPVQQQCLVPGQRPESLPALVAAGRDALRALPAGAWPPRPPPAAWPGSASRRRVPLRHCPRPGPEAMALPRRPGRGRPP